MKYFLLLCFAISVSAQGNLLINPDWQTASAGRVRHWHLRRNAAIIRDGQTNILKLSIDGEAKQESIHLVPGEEYLLRGEVKTTGITTGRTLLSVHSFGWANEAGFKRLSNDTKGKWVKLEQKIIAPPSGDQHYAFAFYIESTSGEAMLKNPELIPLSPKAIAESRSAINLYDQKTIIPVDPLLAKIPVDNPQMLFVFPYELPLGETSYAARIRTIMTDGTEIVVNESFPLKDGKITASLGKLPLGSGELQIRLEERQSGKVFAESKYPITVIKPLLPAKLKQLNRLVAEILQEKAENRSYEFITPRDGWVYLGITPPGQTVKGYLDGNPEPAFSEQAETMRYLTAGKHTVRLEGVSRENEIFHIRTIPELFVYPGNIHKQADLASLNYDYEFYRKYILPSVNTFNHSSLATWNPHLDHAQINKLIRQQGYAWFGSAYKIKTKLESPEELVKRLSDHIALKEKDFAGFTFDEVYMNGYPVILRNYTEALRRLTQLPKPLYTWSLRGAPSVPELHYDYISAATNVSGSRGKIIYECYARTQLTEEQAKNYLRHELVDRMTTTGRFTVNPAEKFIFVNGAYSVPGDYAPYTHPQVDLKYFNEMFFRLLATDPAFQNLYGIGSYGTQYCDEENFRWIARLIRHYGVEGKTEMLSPQYGFTYLPGHLKNCDFEEGLKYWQGTPAEPQSLRPSRYPHYGRQVQRRRGGPPGVGDTFCLFKRSAKAPNSLSQTAENLEPGKYYSLVYYLNDMEKVKAGHGAFEPFAFRVELEGAEIIPDQTYMLKETFLPERRRQNLVFPNSQRIVFKALVPNVKLKFSDWGSNKQPGGPEGQELLLNFISLKPYYKAE